MAGFRFVPRFPEKYAGDARRIVARSRWEIAYMMALDGSNLVHKWISEPRNLTITYLNPVNNKVKTYWPDFLVQYVSGEIDIVEIKPAKESAPGKAASLYDKLMLAQNIAKWQAAEKFAQRIGAKFRVVTEDQLFARKTKGPVKSKGTKK
jgi:hypothetical protein